MKIEIKNSQLEKKLERKKDFLTLEYISILDNANNVSDGIEKVEKKKTTSKKLNLRTDDVSI
jgi:vacuolar-type H+-ATPase subunit D/Vma8